MKKFYFIISILIIFNLNAADLNSADSLNKTEFDYYIKHHPELIPIFAQYGITKENIISCQNLAVATDEWLDIEYLGANGEKKILTLDFNNENRKFIFNRINVIESESSKESTNWCILL